MTYGEMFTVQPFGNSMVTMTLTGPILTHGTNRLGGEVDTDALEKYFVKSSPVAPGPQNRITRVP